VEKDLRFDYSERGFMEHRMRLLVIDDDRMMCQLLTEYLTPNARDS